jgi:hypothetical protein
MCTDISSISILIIDPQTRTLGIKGTTNLKMLSNTEKLNPDGKRSVALWEQKGNIWFLK